MNKLIAILALVFAFVVVPMAQPVAQVAPVGASYYPLKIAKFNASYRSDQQALYYTSNQIGKLNNSLHVDTSVWVPIPRLLIPLDTLVFGLACRTNIDTLSHNSAIQYGFAAAPDSGGVSAAGAFASLSGAALSLDNFAVARKTTITYDVVDFARIKYANIPPGATMMRLITSWQASGQSIESDGTATDQYEWYLVYPKQE